MGELKTSKKINQSIQLQFFNHEQDLIAILFFGFALCAAQPARGGEFCNGCSSQLSDPLAYCAAECGYDVSCITQCIGLYPGIDYECLLEVCCMIEHVLNIPC